MQFSLIQKLCDTPIVFIDVETTGASAAWGDRVMEVGVVRVERGEVVAEFSQLIDAGRRINAGVSVLTCITQSMLLGQPMFADILPRLLDVMRGAVVAGHNIRFDLSFLRNEFRHCRVDLAEALGHAPVVDTVRIARRQFGKGGNGLQRLAPRLGIQPAGAHRALADAQTTHRVFEKLIESLGGWAICLADVIQHQGGPMNLLPGPSERLLPLELEEALAMRLSVMMEYLDSSQNRTRRVIQPLHIRRRSGEMVLVAHCELRNEQRTFKLDRIVRLERIAPPDVGLFASNDMLDQPVRSSNAPNVPETTRIIL